MSSASSSPDEWWSVLEPAAKDLFFGRGDPEDPRLGEVVRRWEGGAPELHALQPVIVGFPCDEGVRRNGGRVGAAQAPDAIRRMLYRFTPWDRLADVDMATADILDLGNVKTEGALETSQERLGQVVAALLRIGAVPIVLGGGHETAFGHYLGYAANQIDCGIINLDAHLDVRPFPNGGHSGSPFRQAMQHAPFPLANGRYVVIGAQRQSIARAHWEYVREREGRIHWLDPDFTLHNTLSFIGKELTLLAECEAIWLTIDADAFAQCHVPAVSAPGPLGLDPALWPELAFLAGATPKVRSIEIVEVNPLLDRDHQTARWAALGVRQFLVGLASREVKE